MTAARASVKVAVRVRPLNARESEEGPARIVAMPDGKTTVLSIPSSDAAELPDASEPTKTFTFDHAYDSTDASAQSYASQERIFADLGAEVLDSAFAGFNACIFAYGQTGSGKSYSIMGTDASKGIIPRLCEALFARIRAASSDTTEFRVEVSYMEVYNEKVMDLLDGTRPPTANAATPPRRPSAAQSKAKVCRVREHPQRGPYVENLSKFHVSDPTELLAIMERGAYRRTVAATDMNETSSRSHAIFTIDLRQTRVDTELQLRNEICSRISLVDLAGSERVKVSNTSGDRLKEGANINKSLSTLGLVIKALVERSSPSSEDDPEKREVFVPYRDSVLTWLLKESLGGNSKTIMLATVSPAAIHFEETLSTLRYAQRAKSIVNVATVNEDPQAKLIIELKNEVQRLRALVGGSAPQADARDGEISTLKEKLASSERLMHDLRAEYAAAQEKDFHDDAESRGPVDSAKSLSQSLPHLVNLGAEGSLFVLKPGAVSVGTLGALHIDGDDVGAHHAVVEYRESREGVVELIPMSQQHVVKVNGEAIVQKAVLQHGDVVAFGAHQKFRLVCPPLLGSMVPCGDTDSIDSQSLHASSSSSGNSEVSVQLERHLTYERTHGIASQRGAETLLRRRKSADMTIDALKARIRDLEVRLITSSSTYSTSPSASASASALANLAHQLSSKQSEVAGLDREMAAFLAQQQQVFSPERASIPNLTRRPAMGPARTLLTTHTRRSTEDTIIKYVSLSIPKATLVHPPDSDVAYTVYFVKVSTPTDEWTIPRRYSKFYALFESLRPLCPPLLSSRFPKQRLFFSGSKSLEVVEARRESLEWWLQGVLVWASRQEDSALGGPMNGGSDVRAAVERDVSFLKRTERDEWLLEVIGSDAMSLVGGGLQ